MTKLAVIRVRGQLHIKHPIKITFTYLNLQNKNSCIIIEETPVTKGMIQKIRNYVTWGPVNEDILNSLKKKHPKQTVYNLPPPLKGYGRKGIKMPFAKGGALGERGEKINDLLKRMIR